MRVTLKNWDGPGDEATFHVHTKLIIYCIILLLTVQAEALLGNTETSLNNSRDILADLGERLATLEQQIEQNRVDLVEAKNLSSITRELANNVENVRNI